MEKSRTLVGSRALSANRWKPAWSAIITCSELDDVGDLFEENCVYVLVDSRGKEQLRVVYAVDFKSLIQVPHL